MTLSKLRTYDALLVCSFGGPNRTEDVLPFLRNVVAGKNVPEERLAQVGEHYFHFGGKSPINEQNLDLVAHLQAEFRRQGIQIPVLWGNRNWHPYTADTLRDAHAFGARRILVLITSAYASYSGSRQYREHLAAAIAELGPIGAELEVDVLRPFFNDPGFINANAAGIIAAAQQLPSSDPIHIAYVTHSIPDAMEAASAVTGPSYKAQHELVVSQVDQLVAASVAAPITSSLSYCSRSGDPRTPWLEPDISDELTALSGTGVKRVIIAPIGFISDHMEVAYDLDIEAMETATELGLTALRAPTAGVHSEFISGLVRMVIERADREAGLDPVVHVAGALAPLPDVAPPGSCRMRHGEITGVPVIAGSAD